MTNSNFGNVQGKKDFRANNNYEKSNTRRNFGSNKESGGFRIRLSDNEMKAARTIQENFQLKSTVAVLGFSVRTLSELLKDENLKNVISKYAQNNKNASSRNYGYCITSIYRACNVIVKDGLKNSFWSRNGFFQGTTN